MSGVIDLTSDDDERGELERPANVVPVSDDEDEDLKQAIALSLQDQADIKESATTLAVPVNPPLPTITSTASVSTQSGLLGLDRRAMEAERLARLKRKREPESATQADIRQPPPQPSSTSTRISPPPPGKQKSSLAQSTTIASRLSTTTTSSTPPSFQTPRVLYTSEPSRRNPKDPTKYMSISFADIIAPPSTNLQLKSTLLSSFIADFDWILPHFNTRTTTFLLILHAQNAQHRALLEGDFAGLPNVKLVIPEVMGGAGNMHSKVMLLFYQAISGSDKSGSNGSSDSIKEICRLVIPSANLTRADWGVGEVMENVLFVVDLPLKQGTHNVAYRFEKKLRAQLAAMQVPEGVLRKLDRFDFAATKNIEFVHSNSGSHLLRMSSTKETMTSGGSDIFQRRKRVKEADQESDVAENRSGSTKDGTDDPARTGLLSLNDAVVSSGLDTSSDDLDNLPQVDFITSSLGNLTSDFIRQLYLAICGQLDPAKIVAKTKRLTTKSTDRNVALDQAILQNLKIYFPSSETVRRSKGGPGAGGTICFQRKWWDSNNLIRQCLHDCVGVRGDGILMHSKILYVRFRAPKVVRSDGHDRLYLGWVYIGSANLSESAWGRVVSDAKSKQPKLTCRNWESGVLLPVEVENAVKTRSLEDEAAAGGPPQLGREYTKHVEGVSNEAKEDDPMNVDGDAAPTSVGRVVMQVKVEKEKEATRSGYSAAGKGKGNGLRKSKEEGVTDASMQQDADKFRELPSLVQVFSEVVPVPLKYPASSHVARQNTPWFFME